MRLSVVIASAAVLLVTDLGANELQFRGTENTVQNSEDQMKLLGPAVRELQGQPGPQDLSDFAPGSEARTTEFLPNGDFEDGPAVWTEFSLNGWDLILHSSVLPVTPHSGDWAVWLGGDLDEISFVEQRVDVPESSPEFKFWYWIASEDICGWDLGGVVVNSSTVIDVFDLCESNNTGGWTRRSVNMAAYAGQTVDIQIRAETDGSLNSNLFVDDVYFEFDAPAGGIFTDGFESGDTSAWSSTVQ